MSLLDLLKCLTTSYVLPSGGSRLISSLSSVISSSNSDLRGDQIEADNGRNGHLRCGLHTFRGGIGGA